LEAWNARDADISPSAGLDLTDEKVESWLSVCPDGYETQRQSKLKGTILGTHHRWARTWVGPSIVSHQGPLFKSRFWPIPAL